MWNNWNNDSCLPDAADPCRDGGYPGFVVNATSAEHVRLAVDFARKHNVRLIVKGTGHDHMGRSSAPYATLSIWTHHIKDLRLHTGSFTPKGCEQAINTSAVTAGAGAQMRDLYEGLDTVNQTVVGGGAYSVGVGGYLTGGGHSILSPRRGLAADQVLEMEVVTPGGEVVIVNECQHQDLFWAMRGGGGSTFGVMTSVTLKTYPTPSMLHMDFYLFAAAGDDRAWDAVAYMLSQFPNLTAQGLSAYTFVVTNYPNPLGAGPPFLTGMYGRAVLQDVDDAARIQELFAPVAAHVNATWPGGVYFVPGAVTRYGSFLEWYRVYYDNGTAGADVMIASRLLDGKALTSNVTALRDAVRSAAEGAGGLETLLVSGPGVHDAVPRGGSDAVGPAWRTAYVHAIAATDWLPFNATMKAAMIANLNSSMQSLRDLAPNTGAYVNEAFPYEPDWQHTFWGDHYERLVDIKRRVDPDDVLWCTPCVGNERWEEVGDMLCRV